MTITVSDDNDITPTCSSELYTTTLAENTADSTSLGVTLGCSDTDDTSPNNDITYSISSGNTNSAFAISSSTGDITVNTQASLDIETTPTFTLVIKAVDGGTPPLTATATVVVNLIDVNEAAPSFTGTPYTALISEDSSVGDTVS